MNERIDSIGHQHSAAARVVSKEKYAQKSQQNTTQRTKFTILPIPLINS